MGSSVLAFVAILSFLVCFGSSKRVGWHDPNIVCCNKDGSWIQVPEDVNGSPPPIADDLWNQNDSSTVVLIAALRETRLVDTLYSLFTAAAHPQHVVAAVVQQNDPSDPDCLEQLCEKLGTPLVRREHPITAEEAETADLADAIRNQGIGGSFHLYMNPNKCKYFDQVRVLRMPASEAAGPVYARGKGNELVEDEDFCMQIDAHTLFKPEWDVLFKREWAAAKNEYAVLTTYPTNYKDMNKNSNNHWEMPHLCAASLRKGSALVTNGQAKAAANLDRPLLAPLWAAGLSYSRCHAETRVPNDPNLKQVFQGEEFARGARLWTHGYDFYSITRPIIGTFYGSEKGGKGGWKSNYQEAKASQDRMATLLHAPNSDQSDAAIQALGKYRLGNKRTLQQYFEFSGVDVSKGTVHKNCIVKYVPWQEHSQQSTVSNLRGRVNDVQVLSGDNHRGTLDNSERVTIPAQSLPPFVSKPVPSKELEIQDTTFFMLYGAIVLVLMAGTLGTIFCSSSTPLWFRNRRRVQKAVAAMKQTRKR